MWSLRLRWMGRTHIPWNVTDAERTEYLTASCWNDRPTHLPARCTMPGAVLLRVPGLTELERRQLEEAVGSDVVAGQNAGIRFESERSSQGKHGELLTTTAV